MLQICNCASQKLAKLPRKKNCSIYIKDESQHRKIYICGFTAAKVQLSAVANFINYCQSTGCTGTAVASFPMIISFCTI